MHVAATDCPDRQPRPLMPRRRDGCCHRGALLCGRAHHSNPVRQQRQRPGYPEPHAEGSRGPRRDLDNRPLVDRGRDRRAFEVAARSRGPRLLDRPPSYCSLPRRCAGVQGAVYGQGAFRAVLRRTPDVQLSQAERSTDFIGWPARGFRFILCIRRDCRRSRSLGTQNREIMKLERPVMTRRLGLALAQGQEAMRKSVELARATMVDRELPNGIKVRTACCFGYSSEVAAQLYEGQRRTVVALFDLRSQGISLRRSADS